MTPTLLVDGDVIAYTAASAAQKDVRWPDGVIYRWSYPEEGMAILEGMLISLKKKLNPGKMLIALTTTTQERPNWRNAVWSGYKANRNPADRPQLLSHLRKYLEDEHGALSVPGLEADDILGIWMTGKYAADGIIVTKDKDLRTIPGRLHILGRDGVETVSAYDAHVWHMAQTLAGDRVDGFPGCPNMGMTRALRLLERPVVLNPTHGVVTRGPRKGERTTKWMPKPTNDLWACVVTHYMKNGLAEADALGQARLARILHADDYDYATNTVKLWEPY